MCVDRRNTKGTNTRGRAGRWPAHAVPRARDPATGSGDLAQERGSRAATTPPGVALVGSPRSAAACCPGFTPPVHAAALPRARAYGASHRRASRAARRSTRPPCRAGASSVPSVTFAG
eukprot:5490271-Prymnesium_polylepis.1